MARLCGAQRCPQGNAPVNLSDQLVRRHLMRNPDDQCFLPRVGEYRQVIEDDDIRIGHDAIEHIHEAFGLLDVVAANLERPAIGVAGGRIIGNEQDAGGPGGCIHCDVIIYFLAGGALGRSAYAAGPFGNW